MREIKFRAWDKLENKMYEPIYEAYKGKLFYLTLNIHNGVLLLMGMNGTFASKEIDDRFELMQYTGLKDKNGKEIYEGDIIEMNIYQSKRITKVVFKGGCFWLENNSDMIGNTKGFSCLVCTWVKTLKVIGNIYENKELLNESNSRNSERTT